MFLNNKYWYFDSIVSPRTCDHIIKYALAHEDRIGTIGGIETTSNLKLLYKKRKSNIVWLNDRWIYKEIHPYIQLANQNAGWNFQWDWSESCQFTKYKKSQHYSWHIDSNSHPYTEGSTKGKIRKLSSIVSLSDPSTYTGGELEFDFKESKQKIIKCEEIKNKGSIIVFPSFLWHRVKPVTSGTRYSLVSWHLGNPFV
jgi:PKHD-type hydroxylase